MNKLLLVALIALCLSVELVLARRTKKMYQLWGIYVYPGSNPPETNQGQLSWVSQARDYNYEFDRSRLFGKNYVVFPVDLTTLKFSSESKSKRKPIQDVLTADGRKLNITLEVSYTIQEKDIYPKLWDVYNKTDYETGFADIIENVVREYVGKNIKVEDFDSGSKGKLALAGALQDLIYKKFDALGYRGKAMFSDQGSLAVKKWTINADPRKQQTENKRKMFTQVFTADNSTTNSDEMPGDWPPVFAKLANACQSKGDMPSKRSSNMCVLVKSILVKKIMKYLRPVSRGWKDCKSVDSTLEKSNKCDTWKANVTKLQRVREMLKTIQEESK